MTYNTPPPAALWKLARFLDYRNGQTGRGTILPTKAQVAAYIGVCPTVLTAWLTGRCCPKADKHLAIILAAKRFCTKH